MSKKIYKEIDLSKLPRKGTKIDWKNSIGYKCKFIYDDIEGEIEIVGYEKEKGIFTVIYNNKEFKITRDTLVNCYFGKLTMRRTNEFKFKINHIFKDERHNMVIVCREYKESKGIIYKWYKYHCNNCGYEGWIVESSLVRGANCACCTNQVVVEGINDVATTHPYLIKYFENPNDAKNMVYGSGVKIRAKCKDCGHIKNMWIYNLDRQGFGCNECGDGIKYPNKFLYSILNQLNIDYIKEYHPKWALGKFYDVYIPSLKLIIEMDGGLGHGNKDTKYATKEESKNIDELKDNLANEHGIKVIRIDCNYDNSNMTRHNYIKNNIFNSEIKNILNLSIINWDNVESFCSTNIVKLACELKKNNPNLYPYEIGLKLNLSHSTIIRYLKIGRKLGWCNYDEKQRCKNSSKKIKILKGDDLIGIYESIRYIERNSKYICGVKLYGKGISNVCKHITNQYHGFKFEYVDV